MSGPTPPPRRRPPARLLALLVALAAAAVIATVLVSSGAAVPPAAATGSTAAPVSAAGSLGQQVFLRDCAWCHGTSGSGSPRGPSLRDVGEASADFYLRTGRMPLSSPTEKAKAGPPSYSSATISALVAYVGRFGRGTPIPKLAPGDPANGETLFLQNCAPCHSSSGTGAIVTDGNLAPQLYATHSQQVAEAVRVGPGMMPRFGTGQLDRTDVDDIVSYVDQLGSPQVKGGWSLDQYGPILEGTFLWLVPLPLLVLIIRLIGKKAP